MLNFPGLRGPPLMSEGAGPMQGAPGPVGAQEKEGSRYNATNCCVVAVQRPTLRGVCSATHALTEHMCAAFSSEKYFFLFFFFLFFFFFFFYCLSGSWNTKPLFSFFVVENIDWLKTYWFQRTPEPGSSERLFVTGLAPLLLLLLLSLWKPKPGLNLEVISAHFRWLHQYPLSVLATTSRQMMSFHYLKSSAFHFDIQCCPGTGHDTL